MQFSSNSNVYNHSENYKKSIGGVIMVLDAKPIYENDIGVYKDGEAWVVGQMRERGQIFEIGRYLSKDEAEQSAEEYKKEFEEAFGI